MPKNVSGVLFNSTVGSTAGKAGSAYQRNIQNQQIKQEEKWYVGDQPTSREILGQIGRLAKSEPDKANALFSQYNQFTSDPTSPIYAPYRNATNPAVKNLADLGIDASGYNRDWFNNNREWQNYLSYNTNTNTAKTPTKKSSKMENVAYQLNQLAKGLDVSEAVDNEWAAMKEAATYWAGRTDLNLSDDEIYNKVRKDMQSKYPTLYKMDQSLEPGGTLLELNHGTDYSKDSLYGVIWAARNNGGTGDSLADLVMSGMGEGNVWKPNDAISAARQRNDKNTSSPYSVSMTLEDEGVYFGVPLFDDDTIADIQSKTDYDNPTDVKMLNNVVKAHEITKKAKEQLTNLDTLVNRWINSNMDEASIQKNVDRLLSSSDYNILRQMDESIENGTDLVKTTQPINYCRRSLNNRIHNAIEERDGKKKGGQICEEMGIEGPTEGEQQVNNTASRISAAVAASFWDNMSDSEKRYFSSLPGLGGKQLSDAFYNAKMGMLGPVSQDALDPQWVAKMATKQAMKAEESYINTNLDTLSVRNGYEQTRKAANALESKINDIQATYGNMILAQKDIPEDLTMVVDEDTGLTVTYTMDPDGKYRYHPSKNVAISNSLPAQDYMRKTGLTEEQLLEQFQHGDGLDRANNYANSIREAKNNVPVADQLELDDIDTGSRLAIPFVEDGKGGFTLSPAFDSKSEEVQEYLKATGTSEDELWKDINEHIWELNEERDSIPKMSDDLDRMQKKLDSYYAYMSEHQEEYDNAVSILRAADSKRKRIGDVTLRQSGIAVDPAVSDSVVSYISSFADWEKPAATMYSLIDDLYYTQHMSGSEYDADTEAEVKDQVAKIDVQLNNTQYILDTYQNMPKQFTDKINEYRDYINQQKRLYGDYLMAHSDNFEELVEKGKEMNMNATSLEAGVNALAFSQMNKEEQDIYFALIASEGFDKAKEFMSDINDNLLAREDKTIEEGTRELAKSRSGRFLNEVLSIGSASVEVPLNLAYMIGCAFGNEDKWLRVPSKAAQVANQATINELKNIYKDSIWGTVLPGFVEMANNRGRSMVSNYAWGWMIPTGASEPFHAMPIATIAAGEAFEDAIDNDMEPWQAWTLASVNFLAESVTEGIEFGHYDQIFSGGVTLQSFTDYFMGKLANFEWLSEAIGEDLNNVIERSFDKWIGGDKSEHARRVQAYIDSGICDNEKDAELMVAADYVAEDIHTFVISALGSFLDVGTFAGAKLLSNVDYAMQVQDLRKAGDTTTTIETLKNRDRMFAEAVQRMDLNRRMQESSPAPETEQTTEWSPIASEATQKTQEAEYDTDMTILENASDADQTALTSTIAAVLRITQGNAEQAQAAAEAVSDVFGDDAVEAVAELLQGGLTAGVNIGSLKIAMQYALLADGEARRVVQSTAYQNATSDVKAQMLANAAIVDGTSEVVKTAVDAATKESRIAAVEQQLMANNEKSQKVLNAEEELGRAWTAEQDAQSDYEKQQAVVAAKAQAIQMANEMIRNAAGEATPQAVDQLVHATKEHQHEQAVEDEYRQRYENAQKAHQEADQNLQTVKDQAQAEIRAEAEMTVAQEDQQRAEAAAVQEAQMQQAAQQKAEQEAQINEAEVAEETQKQETIEQYADRIVKDSGLTGTDADDLRNRILARAQALDNSREDMAQRIDSEDGAKFLRKISRKTGMTFRMENLGNPMKNRGYIRDGNDIVLNSNLTKGQVLVEAAMHEITHGIENTQAYKPYSDFVVNTLYGSRDSDAYKAAIADKVSEYARFGKTLDTVGAEKELVAEYGRQNLASKGFARALASRGLAGQIRMGIRRAIQTMKGYTLSGDDLKQLETLKQAEKLMTNAINERAAAVKEANKGHTGVTQLSVAGVAEAAGLSVEVQDDTNHVYKLYDSNGNQITPGSFTKEMVNDTNAGNLINMTLDIRQNDLKTAVDKGKITQEVADKQLAKAIKSASDEKQFVADMVNLISEYQDAAMVWELAGSMAFSCLKTNGDKQYGDSYDFGTICKKTKAILSTISEAQLMLGRALTKDEIDGIIYEEVGNGIQGEDGKWKHGLTPCPVCYVYATWVNKPARLEAVRQYQNECADWTDEQINEFMSRPDPVGKNNTETKELVTEQKRQKLWIECCLAEKQKDGTWVRRENPDICPNEVLLDLRRSEDMATKYPGTWSFMQKGGNAQGKAIAPYSDSRLGESIVVKAKGADVAGAELLADEANAGKPDYIPQFVNPFLTGDRKTAEKYLKSAMKKAVIQNLKGGQRWQSWSDFRAEWGSDYLMEMMTMQLLGAKVQTYTKVIEAVDMMATGGFEINLSGMPHGDGFYHNDDGSIAIDENGKLRLRFSNVTGIDYDAAMSKVRQYAQHEGDESDGPRGNVQLMTVGISDQHIEACLDSDDVTFVIPFHGSGGSVKRVQHLMSLLRESLNTGNDYTKVQSDKYIDQNDKGKNTNPNWSLRVRILTGNKNFNDSEMEAIRNNPFLSKLYDDRFINTDSEAFEVYFTNDDAQQIYPYEYWETEIVNDDGTTRPASLADADRNNQRFIDYCNFLGVVPRFSGETRKAAKGDFFTEDQYGNCPPEKMVYDENGRVVQYEFGNFSGRTENEDGSVTYDPKKGYWKLLIDRPMYTRYYDKDGNLVPEKSLYHTPQTIDVSGVKVGAMPETATATAGYADDEARQIAERAVQRIEMTSGQNEAAGSMVDMDENRQIVEMAQYGEATEEGTQASRGGRLTDAEIDELILQYGMASPEELGRTDVPRGQQRQFGSQTAQSTDGLHGAAKVYLYNHSDYTPDSNGEQIDRAIEWIKSNASEGDADGYYDSMNKVLDDNFQYWTADGQARTLAVMAMAAAKAEAGERSALADEIRLADAYNQEGTDIARALQARQIFRMMTPVGRISWARKQTTDLIRYYAEQGKKVDAKLSEETLNEMGNADTEEKIAKARKKVMDELSNQLPANWKDKFHAWRMFSMLGNPKTHIRNFIGNGIFIPAVGLKNRMGATLEAIYEKKGLIGEGERTKTWRKATTEQRAFAEGDINAQMDTLTGEAKYDDRQKIMQNRKIFGTGDSIISQVLGGLVQKGSDISSNWLEKEDAVFLKYHYINSLAGWMAANNLTEQDLIDNPEMLQKGRTYAIQEAQKATYRDMNAFSTWVGKASKLKGGWLVDAVLPFKKTPANILKRGVEYSPVGLIKSLTYDRKHLKEYKMWQDGQLSTKPKDAISPTQWLDRIASGMSGTAITALGMFFKAMGWATGSLDDPEDEFKKANGEQEYSLKIPGVGSFTMDWAAPVCMPFFVGVELMQEFGDGIDLKEALGALASVTEPVWNLSMLDGVNSLFQTNRYSDANSGTQVLLQIVANYGSSFVPTFFGQVARTIDDTRRKSYVNAGSDILSPFYYAYEQIQNKTPGWSKTNIPYRDVWGNPDQSGFIERLIENFISPGYWQAEKPDPVTNELAALYDETGNSSMVPKDPDKSISVNKDNRKLDAEQWDLYKTTRNKTAYDSLTDLFNSDYYKSLSDPYEKAKLVSSVWEYSTEVGKKKVFSDYKMNSYGKDPVRTIMKKDEESKRSNRISDLNKEMLKAIKSDDITAFQTAVAGLKEEKVEEKTIKNKIASEYRDRYKNAYRRGDWDTCIDIETKLAELSVEGFFFNVTDWDKDVRKEETPKYKDTIGQYGEGNIDLNNRQVVENDDGTISTELSFSFYDDDVKKEVLIPTVIDGEIVSDDEAIQHYYNTGEYLGMFDTPEEADRYAEELHERQEWYYNQ